MPDALSEESMAAYRADLLGAALLTFGIVLVTIAVIYLLVMLLTGRLTVLSDSLVEASLETLQVLGSAIAKRCSDTEVETIPPCQLAVPSTRRPPSSCSRTNPRDGPGSTSGPGRNVPAPAPRGADPLELPRSECGIVSARLCRAISSWS
jgi:hypothetical protein